MSREYPGKKGASRLGKINVKVPHQRSPYAVKVEVGLTNRLKDKSDVPKARLGILPNGDTSSKRTTRLHSSRLQKK